MKKMVLMVLFVVAGAAVACAASPPIASGYAGDDSSADAAAADGGNADPIAPPGDAAAAPGWTPYLRGAVAVEARGCPQCHQSTNTDDGVLSGQTSPVPGTRAFGANLTPDPETGIGRLTDDQIVRAIRAGTDEENAPLCAVMPRFADMEDDEATAIVAYLRGIQPVHREIPSSECAREGGADDSNVDGGDGGESVATADASSPGALNCAAYAAPTVSAACHACLSRPCQANGCFGGYYCDTSTWTCHPQPDGCK
jgi:hypothetical protein